VRRAPSYGDRITGNETGGHVPRMKKQELRAEFLCYITCFYMYVRRGLLC
jgi:hypothetical protein